MADQVNDDTPELDEAFFQRAKPAREVMSQAAQKNFNVGGRPKSPAPKRQVTLRLSPRVLDFYRATGPGWQSRIDAALMATVEAPPAKNAAKPSPARSKAASRLKGEWKAP